jgi:hypothetical protein
VIAVFADVISHNSAPVFQMDGVSRCASQGKQPYESELPYKEDSDTWTHSGAF